MPKHLCNKRRTLEYFHVGMFLKYSLLYNLFFLYVLAITALLSSHFDKESYLLIIYSILYNLFLWSSELLCSSSATTPLSVIPSQSTTRRRADILSLLLEPLKKIGHFLYKIIPVPKYLWTHYLVRCIKTLGTFINTWLGYTNY